MEAAGCIRNNEVDSARFGSLNRIEDHGRWVASLAVLDNLDADSVRPGVDLVDSGSSKCVRGGENHALARASQPVRHLGDGGRLPDPVNPNDEIDCRGVRRDIELPSLESLSKERLRKSRAE